MLPAAIAALPSIISSVSSAHGSNRCGSLIEWALYAAPPKRLISDRRVKNVERNQQQEPRRCDGF